MSKQPEVVIKVSTEGAAEAAADFDKVAAAQEDVAAAADKAGAAAAKSGDAAAGGASKWSKLVGGLKAGAGAAAGASAAFAGVAVTLGTGLSESTKVAIAGMQGVAGVLSVFGPLGQLAAAGVSLAAAGVAMFGKDTEFAAVQGEGFIERALKPLIAGFKSTEDAANEASGAIKRVGMAAATDRSIFSPAAMVARTAALDAYNRRFEEHATLYEQAAALERDLSRARADAPAGTTVISGRQDELDRLNAEIVDIGDELSARKFDLDAARAQAEKIASGAGSGDVAAKPGGPAKAKLDAQGNFHALMLDAASRFEDAKLAIAAHYRGLAEAETQAETDRLASLLLARADANIAIAKMQADAESAISASLAAEREATFGRMSAAAEGFGASMANAAAATIIFGEGFAVVAQAALEGLAVQAGGEALMEGARAVAAFATYLFNPFNVAALASSKTHLVAAAGFAAIAGGAALGANALGTGAGGGGAGAAGAGAPPSSFGAEQPAAAAEPQSREFFINLGAGSGASGRPLSRGDAGAIIGALVDIARTGGMRLEAPRA